MIKALIAGEKTFVSLLAPVAKNCGMEVISCRTAREAVDLRLRHQPNCVFIQERYEDGLGEDLMNELKKASPNLYVIVSLKRRSAKDALRWMESGAYECLSEPLNPKDVTTVMRGFVKFVSGSFLPRRPFYKRILPPSQFAFRNLLLFGTGIALLFAFLWVGYKFPKKKTETAAELPLSFRLPYPNPTGITWDGKFLWICDWSTQMIYKHRIDAALTLEKHFPMADIPTVSIAWGDDVLWSVGQDGNIRKHLLDGRLTVVSLIRMSGVSPSALAWDGKNLWSSDANSRKIVRHLPDESLTVIASYDFPGKNPVGMVWMGKDLWVADEGTGTLYRLNFDKEVFTLQESLRPGVHLPGTNKLSGLCADGKNIWTISEGTGLLFRHSLSSLRGG